MEIQCYGWNDPKQIRSFSIGDIRVDIVLDKIDGPRVVTVINIINGEV